MRLTDVAPQVGLDFRQGAFRYGVTADPPAYMGGGVCWLDYDNDGWIDLFAVNSYGEGDIGAYGDHLPRSVLYRNDHGRVHDKAWSAPATRGEGCVAADLERRRPHRPLRHHRAERPALLEQRLRPFTEGARKAGVVSFGWHSGAAVGDVNGDGRPDLYVAGYTEPRARSRAPRAGFPTNHLGVRDELFLNRGHRRFIEVGAQVGLDPKPYDHSLGAVFTDLNNDGRLDLYVANDEDPNRAYLNVKGGPLGFRFVDRAKPRRARRPERRHGRRRRRPQLRLRAGLSSSRTHAARGTPSYRIECTGEDCALVDAREQVRGGVRRRTSPAGATPGSTSNNDGNARPRARERRHPGQEPREGRRADPGDRARVGRLGRRERRSSAPTRSRASTAAASPPPTSTTTATWTSPSARSAGKLMLLRSTGRHGPLARGEAEAVRPGRDRHRRRCRAAASSCRRCTPARATSPRRTRASTSASARRRRCSTSRCATRTARTIRRRTVPRPDRHQADRVVTALP